MNKENSIGRWISILYRYGQIYVGKRLKPFGIGKGQFMYLMKLFEKDGLTQDELSEKLNMDKGTTARALLKLEEQGYIVRKENKHDRRSNQVFLTEQSKNMKSDLFSVLHDWTEILSQNLSEEERQQVLVLLDRMSNNAAEYIYEHR